MKTSILRNKEIMTSFFFLIGKTFFPLFFPFLSPLALELGMSTNPPQPFTS